MPLTTVLAYIMERVAFVPGTMKVEFVERKTLTTARGSKF